VQRIARKIFELSFKCLKMGIVPTIKIDFINVFLNVIEDWIELAIIVFDLVINAAAIGKGFGDFVAIKEEVKGQSKAGLQVTIANLVGRLIAT
jgi:hypothetical protein